MNPLASLYQELLAGGYRPEDIPGIIQKLSAGQQAGMFQNLNIGTAEQDRQDRLAEQARLAQEFRVQTGLGAAGLMQTDEQNRAQREGDPFRFVEYLRGVSDLQPGQAGNPVASLIGSGFSIKPQLPTDPRYDTILDDLAKFGRPVGQANGGMVRMEEPGAIIGQSGQIYSTLNENGPESLKVTPQAGVSQRLDPNKQDDIISKILQQPLPPSGPLPVGIPSGEMQTPLPPSGQLPGGVKLPQAPQKKPMYGGFQLFSPGARTTPRRAPTRPQLNYRGAASGAKFGWATRDADIKRMAATPGAAEAFANYDRQRASSGQDASFGPSTRTTARPNGQVAYIHTADGRVEGVANPVGLAPGNWENVQDANGVGRWQQIDEAQTAALQLQNQAAARNRLMQLGSGNINTAGHQAILQRVLDAGGRPGSIMHGMALADRQRSPYVSYTAAYPGGPNIINIEGNGQKNRGMYDQMAAQTGGTYNETLRYPDNYGDDGRGSGGQQDFGAPKYPSGGPRRASSGGTPPAAAPTGAVPTSGDISPAQAAAMAMGKALENNPYAPRELILDLKAGKPANPAYLTQRLRQNLDKNLWTGLMSTNQGFGYRPDAVLQSAQQFDIPSFQTQYRR